MTSPAQAALSIGEHIFMMYAFLAMMGWCGTKWPGWWRGPHPVPDPEPWWDLAGGVLGMIGGIVAGEVFRPATGDAGFMAVALTAFFGGTFVSSFVSALLAMGTKKPA
jgi:hypothetical protein